MTAGELYVPARLTAADMTRAANAGVELWANSQAIGYRGWKHFPRGSWVEQIADMIECQATELVWHQHRGLDWTPNIGSFKDRPDVDDHGIAVEVRGSVRHDRNLIVRDDDVPDRLYVLVTGGGPDFRIHGGIYGAKAQRVERSDLGNGGSPCHLVKRHELNPPLPRMAPGEE